jgi:glycosyltransferase involved in cell wall biosynthesis
VSRVRDLTIAVIPCLDEAGRVGAVVRGLSGTVSRILVVDDGSSDGTAAEAGSAGATVLRHSKPLGKGAALAAGWRRARELGGEWMLMLDGDGQHDPAEAPAFIAAAETGARLVVGNRMPGSRAMPVVRRWTNRWMSRRISALAGLEVPDSQCGYRLVHLPSLEALALRCRGYEIESEMTVAFARAGHPMAFVPVRVRYGGERSKISPLRDTARWFRWYLRTRSAQDGRR